MFQQWLTTAQAAVYTGYAKATLHTYRSLGKGPPFFKVANGYTVRYRRDDLDNFMARGGDSDHPEQVKQKSCN